MKISSEEIESGVMDAGNLETAVSAMRLDGIVVLENVVDLEHVEILRAKMVEDVALLMKRKDAPFNWNSGNVQQEPPPFPPYLFKDVLLNDMAIAVTKSVLGNGVKNGFYSGNTAVLSTERQPVHADTGQLWANLEVASPAFNIVVNVPLVDFSPENGSTEIWVGSHLDTSVDVHSNIEVSAEALEQRRAISPPIQPSVKAGSVILRDIRLWHAGMPNKTSHPRPMVAMIHVASWWAWDGRLKFPKGSEDFFKHPHLNTLAEFVEGEIDYIRAPQAYAYEK